MFVTSTLMDCLFAFALIYVLGIVTTVVIRKFIHRAVAHALRKGCVPV